MKKWTAIIMMGVLLLSVVTGCTTSSSNEPASEPTVTSEQPETDTPKTPETEEYYYEYDEPIVTSWKNSIGTVWVEVAMPIYNKGQKDLYLGSAKFDIEDTEGHLIETVDYVTGSPEVLRPGETGWYYETTILDIENPQELVGIPHEDVEKSNVDCIRFEVSDVTIKDNSWGDIEIIGRVENTTDKDESLARIVFNLFDASGNFLASAFTYESVKAGEKVGFSISSLSLPNDISAADIDHYEAYAYPTQFNF